MSSYSAMDDLNSLGYRTENNVKAMKVFLGTSFGESFSAEMAFNKLGSFEISGYGGSGEVKLKNFAISALVKKRVSPRVQLFGKLGMHNWKVKLGSFSQDGTDLFFGIGANVNIGKNIFYRVEYEHFPTEYDGGTADTIGLTSMSLVMKF